MEDRSYSIDTYVKDNFFEVHDIDGHILIDMIRYQTLCSNDMNEVTLRSSSI